MTARLESSLARMDALIASVHEDCERESQIIAVARPYVAPTVKVCGCCSATFTEASWAQLTRVGLQDDGEGGALALRNCTCGTTLAMPLVMRVTS